MAAKSTQVRMMRQFGLFWPQTRIFGLFISAVDRCYSIPAILSMPTGLHLAQDHEARDSLKGRAAPMA